MPTINEIIQSVAVPSLIKDDFISKGNFQELPFGGYVNYAGGFTVVFPVNVNGEKWAFRCWHHDLGNLRSHFEILSEELQKMGNPYFCDFKYVDEGLIVNGMKFPTTRMRWVEGLDIKQFICEHKAEKLRLKYLAGKFLEMIQTLHQQGIAHGDLQHGNILVDKNDDIFLIDYDSVYLPALKGQTDIITGLKGYQHPNRADNINASEKLDYFSELIIYTSIVGVAENPNLVDKYELEDSEQMLFSPDDFNDLVNSRIYKDLSELKGVFPKLLDILKLYLLENDINNLEPFDILMDSYYPKPKILFFKPERGQKVVVGTEAKIVWAIENVSELYLNGTPIEVYQKSHQELFATLGTRCFELVAINGIKQEKGNVEIEVVDGAVVHFTSNTFKLKRGQEERATLKWEVDNAKSVLLTYGNIEKVVPLRDTLVVFPEDTTTYRITATSKEGNKQTVQELTLLVLEASKVEFKADKLYSFPSIPVKLSWNVEYAREVKLDDIIVEHVSTKVIEVDRDTTFTLSVTDEFGSIDYPLAIRMLPLPFIRSVMIPTPNIKHNITIVNKVPRPKINIDLIPLDLEDPKFSFKIPKYASMPSIMEEKRKLPTGILTRIGAAWRTIEENIVERLKIY